MVERANASLFVQHCVLLSSCLRTPKFATHPALAKTTQKRNLDISTLFRVVCKLHRFLRIESHWLGYSRPIHLKQVLYTPYIHKPISLLPRAGEEQALWHSLMRRAARTKTSPKRSRCSLRLETELLVLRPFFGGTVLVHL